MGRSSILVVVLGLALVAWLGSTDRDGDLTGPLHDVDVAAAARTASVVPSEPGVLVAGGWAEVAAFVQASVDAGQGTVVNLFASWCAPCERELPLLLSTSRETQGVRWLGVDSADRLADAEPFVERTGVHWPIVLDEDAATHTALRGIAMPTTAFFDREGRLVELVTGELDAERLADALAAIVP